MKEPAILNFTNDQIQLIKTQIAPKATDNELQLFLAQAKRTGLDPMTRQIYCIHRYSDGKQKMTIQTSIDGFRVIAERSGDYAGQSEPIFEQENGKLSCCKVTVYRFRGDVRYPAAVGVAYWSEYVPNDKFMWNKMPHTMLAKVAEALALRKAYPQDLSGLYTTEEMNQSDMVVVSENNNESSPIKKLANEINADETETICNFLQTGLSKCNNIADLEKFKQDNKKSFAKLKRLSEQDYSGIIEYGAEKRREFEEFEQLETKFKND